MSKKHTIGLIILYILLFCFVIGCAYLFSSCTVTRHLKSSVKDSTSVLKANTGMVATFKDNKTDSLAWWREIVNYLPHKDTTINNVTTPVYNYPVQIIREGGTQKTVETKINYDSLWNNRLDSLVTRFQQNQKDTKTTVLGFWQILAIAGGVGFVFFLLGKVKIGLK